MWPVNWIDYTLLALIGFAAVRGFMKGLVREVCALVGLVLGIWGAIHFNHKVAVWLGLQQQNEAVSFLVTLVIIVLALHFIGIALTKVIDAAQLSIPNKLGGLVFGAVRKAFLLSVVLNVLFAKHNSAWAPSLDVQKESALFGPLRAFAPAVIPALGETKWVKKALDDLKAEVEKISPE